MSNGLIPLEQLQAHLPQRMQERRAQGVALNKNFIEGVREGFPTLSIKGKVFRFRHQGVEQPALDANRKPVSYIDVILVDASPTIAKTYYAKGYVEGDMDPPDCWSLDSVKPDPSVENKVSPTCLNCPMNQFGSRVTDRGSQAKACSDQRRIAITMPHHLDVPAPLVVLSRIPQGSLKNLKAYADQLDRYGVEINAVITRLSFDHTEAFPKLVFEYAGALNDLQYDVVLDLVEGEETRAMLTSPITDAASDNLDSTQTVRTPVQRAAPPTATVTPIRPAQAPNPLTGAPASPAVAQAPNPLTAAAPPAQVQTPVQQAPTPTAVPTQAPVMPGGSVGGLVSLGDGRFYNPVTQALCDANGNPLGMTAAPAVTQPAPVQAQPAPSFTPPVESTIEAPAPAEPAPPKRNRRPAGGGAAALAAQQPVQAAPPALDSLLSSLMPK